MRQSAIARSRRGIKEARPRVLIANKFIPHYRQPFFEQLRHRLAENGINFDLVYGDPVGADASKADAVHLDWAIYMPSRCYGWGESTLLYQPIAKLSNSYDLVIVEQANRLLVNPILLTMNALRITRVAFWGHGKTFQGDDGPLARKLKYALVPHVHWWFAYNDLSAAVVRESGFPDERITRVMNTIDNDALQANLNEITDDDIEKRRETLGLQGRNVCIYIGGMYDKKRLPFLFEACEEIRRTVSDFEILFLGSGVDKPFVDDFAARHRWAISCGPTFGREKALNLRLAKLMLMPGLVGLAIIDSFSAQVPIVTTRVPYHSPEIDYLLAGINGEMVQSTDSIGDYAFAVKSLLTDSNRLNVLREGCKRSAAKYTMGSMVSHFADGVRDALQL